MFVVNKVNQPLGVVGIHPEYNLETKWNETQLISSLYVMLPSSCLKLQIHRVRQMSSMEQHSSHLRLDIWQRENRKWIDYLLM